MEKTAHNDAWKGKSTDDPKILKLKDSEGWTVAYIQIMHGKYITNEEVLKLKHVDKRLLVDIQLDAGWEPSEEDKKIPIVAKVLKDRYIAEQLKNL